MKWIKQLSGDIVVCIIELLVGIMLLVDAEAFSKWTIIVFGTAMIVLAAMQIFKYFRADALEAAEGNRLFIGLILLAIGCICICGAGWLMKKVASFIAIAYGIGILLAGFGKIQWTVNAVRVGGKNWMMHALTAVVSVIFAAIILINPFETAKAFWIFTGIALIVESAVDLVSFIIRKCGGEDEI